MKPATRSRSLLWLIVAVSIASCSGASPTLGGPAAAAASPAGVAPTDTPAPQASTQATSVATPSAAASTGRIAFTRYDTAADRGSAFTIGANGTGEHQVGTGDVSCGTWSPDGKRVLCLTWFEGIGARPAVANADGSAFHVLDAYPGRKQSIGCSDWIANATRLLCTSDFSDDPDPTDHGLYTVRASDGGDLRRITTSPSGCIDYEQVPAPDGSAFVFDRVCGQDEHGVLYRVDADGANLRALSASELFISDPYQHLSAAWSHDGTRVAYVALVPAADSTALYVVNADGSETRQIVPTDTGAVTVRWSPNDRLIAFTSRFRSHPQVWVVRPDGSGLAKLTSGTDGSISVAPIWSPDGAKLLYVNDLNGRTSLRTVDPDGSDNALLAQGGGEDWLDWGRTPEG